MYIFKDLVIQQNINGSGNDYATTPWSGSQIDEFDFIQSADTGIITHKEVAPQTIIRTSDTTWTIGAAPLINLPQFDYNDASSPPPTTEIQDMSFSNMSEGDKFRLSLNGVLTDEIVYAAPGINGEATNVDNMVGALLALPITANSGISAFGNGADSYTFSFAGANANDWGLMTATPIVVSDPNFAVTTSRAQAGISRKENVWSPGRGWPVSCTFHESRLYFGGSASRPSTVWGSRVNDFFNYEAGIGRDDESIDITLDTDQVNAIQSIYSNRALQVFTTGAEFYAPQTIGQPLTPSGITISPQTNLGSRRVRPVTIRWCHALYSENWKIIKPVRIP